MTLLSILLVAKAGIVSAVNVKEFVESDLFKRAGFKHADGFEKRTVYLHGDKEIHVYGKVTGRAGQENKYEFPPPIAEMLFFGTVVLVSKVKGVPSNLSEAEWEQAYDALMGGFEDLGAEDSETTASSEEEPSASSLTRDGYVKDNFVVDDEEEEEEEEESEEEEKVVEMIKQIKVTKRSKKTLDQVFGSATRALTSSEPENVGLDCSHELTAEEYD